MPDRVTPATYRMRLDALERSRFHFQQRKRELSTGEKHVAVGVWGCARGRTVIEQGNYDNGNSIIIIPIAKKTTLL